MIKDSKLIGTKIAAPYGWKKFKVGELFNCKPLNRPEIAGYTGYVKDDMVISPYGHTPYLAATSDNNGISGYSNLKANNKANVITLSTTADSSNTVFYQEQEFIGRQQMEGLRLKSKVLTKNLAFYFIPFIKKQACLFNYGNKLTVNKLKNFIIIVPVTSTNKPDFAWMEQYMKLVQEDYLQQKKLSNQAEIKAYLTESQTDSLEITQDDKEFLHEFDKLPRQKFKVGELFDIIRPVSDNFSLLTIPYDDRVDGVSYVNCSTAGINNNGCPLVIERKYVNLENVLKYGITVSANGANTGSVFVQSSDFIVLQDSYCLILKSGNKNVFVYQFLSTLLFKYKVQFNYQVKASWTRVSQLSIDIPVLPNSQVDVASIEKYMQIQSKPLINKVAEIIAPAGATN